MKTLHEIADTLRLALNSDALYSLVSTRISLRTGIDLTTLSPDQEHSAEGVESVLEVLKAMGYSLEALRVVAQLRR